MLNVPEPPPLRFRLAGRALAAYILVILFLSLYPWRFGPRRLGNWEWLDFGTRGEVLDAILNFWFYVPAGLFAYFWTKPPFRWAAGMGTGLLLSASIEFAQQWVPGRYSNIHDLAANVSGSVAGALAAWGLSRPAVYRELGHFVGTPSSKLSPERACLLLLWIVAQGFPFVPGLRMLKIRETLAQLQTLDGTWPQAAAILAGFAALAIALERTLWLPAAFLMLPLQGLVLDRRLYPLHVLAGLAGWGLGVLLAPPSRRKLAGAALLAFVVLDEFRPFRFSELARPLDWVPFSGVTSGQAAPYFVSMMGKLYLLAAALWLAARAGWKTSYVAFFLALTLAIGEWTQRFLPGRTPEVADPILALIAGSLIAVAARAVPGKRN